jgi:hypothetical protein
VKRCWLVVFFVFLLLYVAAITQAATFVDLFSDFPTVQGGNGIYAEAYDPLLGNHRLLDSMLTTQGWQFFGTPSQAYGRAKLQKCATEVLLSPSVNRPLTEWSVMTYEVSESGVYSLEGKFCSRLATDSATALIYVNDSVIDPFWAGLVAGLSGRADFSINRYLNKGDKLRFAVDSGAADGDFIYLSGTVSSPTSAVPEPASITALVLGLSAIVAARRKNRSI